MIIEETKDLIVASQKKAQILIWRHFLSPRKSPEVILPEGFNSRGRPCGGIQPIFCVHEASEANGSSIVSTKNILSHLTSDEEVDGHSYHLRFPGKHIKQLTRHDIGLVFEFEYKYQRVKSNLGIFANFKITEDLPVAVSLGFRLYLSYSEDYSEVALNESPLSEEDLLCIDGNKTGVRFDSWNKLEVTTKEGFVTLEYSGRDENTHHITLNVVEPDEYLIIESNSDFILPVKSLFEKSKPGLKISFVPH